MRLFADDSIVYKEMKNTCDHALLQQDLASWCEWAETWQLNFNITKCYHLGITDKVVPFSYNYLMNDIVIDKSASAKYLGVTISHTVILLRFNIVIIFVVRLIAGLVFWEGCCRIVPRMSNPRHTLPLYVLN